MDDKVVTRFGETHDQRVKRIINRYQSCVSKINTIFGLIFDETCKPHVTYSKHGCCIGNGPQYFGPAKEELYKKRTEIRKSKIREGINLNNSCSFLDLNSGCILDDIKPPLCIAASCHYDFLERKYNVRLGKDFYIFYEMTNILNDNISQDRMDAFENYLELAIEKIKHTQGISWQETEKAIA